MKLTLLLLPLLLVAEEKTNNNESLFRDIAVAQRDYIAIKPVYDAASQKVLNLISAGQKACKAEKKMFDTESVACVDGTAFCSKQGQGLVFNSELVQCTPPPAFKPNEKK